MRNFLAILLITFGVFVSNTAAQTPQTAVKPTVLPGEVTAINTAANQISLKTKEGGIIVLLNDKTVYKRVSPDAPTDLKQATASSLSEIGVGDGIVAIGIVADDKKTIASRGVYLMTKSDIAKKQQTEREKWQTRGISGKVTAINPATNEITVSVRGGATGGDRNVVVAASDKTKFRRYAQGSVKFSDAVAGNFADVKVGDQLRALGEKTTDGAKLTAEEVVSGSFKMVAGTITAVDAAKREITIKEAQTNKVITVAVNDDTLLRRFPPEMAQRMAMAQAMRASGQMPQGMGAGQGGGGQMPRPNPNAAQGAEGGQRGNGQGGGMMRGAAGGDVDQMLERLPALTVSELKVGDAIAASSTTGAAPDRVTAIKFVAGIEPFLQPVQLPGGQGRQPQQSAPSINIPGLDGIGAP